MFTGVCVDTACSLGFCAEHAAVAEMLKVRQSHVRMIVAVNKDGAVLAPCGRCRELLWQVDDRRLGHLTGRRKSALVRFRTFGTRPSGQIRPFPAKCRSLGEGDERRSA
jgi:cytidine deaminase